MAYIAKGIIETKSFAKENIVPEPESHRMTVEEEYTYYILREMPEMLNICIYENGIANIQRRLNNGFLVAEQQEQLIFDISDINDYCE